MSWDNSCACVRHASEMYRSNRLWLEMIRYFRVQVKSSQKIFIAMQTKLLHNNCPIISTDKCRYIWIWHVTRKQINTTKGMWPSDQLPRLDTPFHRKTPVTHLEIQQPRWNLLVLDSQMDHSDLTQNRDPDGRCTTTNKGRLGNNKKHIYNQAT